MNIDDIIENAQLKGRVIALEAELESEKAAMKALMTTPTSRLLRAEREENARLKAEVERLTERNKFLEQIDSYLQGANENAYEKRCNELEAEVERLRKAGTEMGKHLPDTDEANRAYIDFEAGGRQS